MRQKLPTPATPLEILSLFLPAGLLDYFLRLLTTDCKKRLNYMEETAYTTTLFRFYLFQIIRRSHTEFIFKTLTKIDRTVNSHLERNF